mmetsp:Transcript_99186/g.265253  ORF Transcript_99186/g.265253 Transcript_99186/m.265253 type:complete len:224 (-) Transcript_99186:1442-2113(-)
MPPVESVVAKSESRPPSTDAPCRETYSHLGGDGPIIDTVGSSSSADSNGDNLDAFKDERVVDIISFREMGRTTRLPPGDLHALPGGRPLLFAPVGDLLTMPLSVDPAAVRSSSSLAAIPASNSAIRATPASTCRSNSSRSASALLSWACTLARSWFCSFARHSSPCCRSWPSRFETWACTNCHSGTDGYRTSELPSVPDPGDQRVETNSSLSLLAVCSRRSCP